MPESRATTHRQTAKDSGYRHIDQSKVTKEVEKLTLSQEADEADAQTDAQIEAGESRRQGADEADAQTDARNEAGESGRQIS